MSAIISGSMLLKLGWPVLGEEEKTIQSRLTDRQYEKTKELTKMMFNEKKKPKTTYTKEFMNQFDEAFCIMMGRCILKRCVCKELLEAGAANTDGYS